MVISFSRVRWCEIPALLPLALMVLGALAVYMAPPHLLLAILAVELVYTAVGGVDRLSRVAVPMAVFIAPILLVSAAMQILVGGLDVAVLVLSMLRIAVLYLTTVVCVRMLSIGRLVRDLSRFSPSIALPIAVSIRMLSLGLYALDEVRGVYRVNLASMCSSFRCRVGYTLLLAKAITRILILTALDMGESIYARHIHTLKHTTTR